MPEGGRFEGINTMAKSYAPFTALLLTLASGHRFPAPHYFSVFGLLDRVADGVCRVSEMRDSREEQGGRESCLITTAQCLLVLPATQVSFADSIGTNRSGREEAIFGRLMDTWSVITSESRKYDFFLHPGM